MTVTVTNETFINIFTVSVLAARPQSSSDGIKYLHCVHSTVYTLY